MSVPARAYLSIGEVLSRLRPEFSDITISKIRFLESEGLIDPQRTPSGYRKFTTTDLERLRYVLMAQRDQYLPLRVIKENLDALDRGLEPAKNSNSQPTPRLINASADAIAPLFAFAPSDEIKLSRSEFAAASGLTDAQISELESFGFIQMKGRYFDGDALEVAKAINEFTNFGIEARHLKSFKTAADREVGLVEQVTIPLARQKSSDAKARAQEAEREISSLSIKLHAALVRSGLHRSR
jgi:DNA-binding transcriptional MerR regulator